jgi:hypothetical protein
MRRAHLRPIDRAEVSSAPRSSSPGAEAVADPELVPGVPCRVWLERAVDLAMFILGDRAAALEVGSRALAHLPITAAMQGRRSGYVLRGRTRAAEGSSRASRTRVQVSNAQLLQRLVYMESEPWERLQERAGRVDEGALTARFVKHLVRGAMRRNSFYVGLAISRLLHRYSTVEAQDLYSAVLQDPGRVPDDDYYRSRKRQLMEELRARFGDHISVVTSPRGEQRFEAREDQAAAAPVVAASLARFTPWGSTCSLPEDFDARSMELPGFHFDGADPDDEHPIEVDRIHAFLHPPCFRRLTRALQLVPPEERLDAPRFAISSDNAPPPLSRDRASLLTDEEWQQAVDRMGDEAARRRHGWGRGVSVSIDGGERTFLDLERYDRVRIPVAEGAERVNVEAADGTLLATCLLDGGSSATSASVPIAGGRRFEFRLESDGSTLEVLALEAGWLSSLAWAVTRSWHRSAAAARASWSAPPRLGALAGGVLAAILAVLVVLRPTDRPQATLIPEGTPAVSDPPAPPAAASIPPASGQTPSSEDTTRDLTLRPRGRQISEIDRIFVGAVAPAGRFGTALRRALRDRLDATGRFRTIEDRARADAWLEVAVRAASGERRVTAVLVNADGDIVWKTEMVEPASVDPAAIAAKAVEALTAVARRQVP